MWSKQSFLDILEDVYWFFNLRAFWKSSEPYQFFQNSFYKNLDKVQYDMFILHHYDISSP